jgi:hypothetical protein
MLKTICTQPACARLSPFETINDGSQFSRK